MKKGDKCKIDFAGSILKVEYVGEDELLDGTKVSIFTDGRFSYPVRRKNILK